MPEARICDFCSEPKWARSFHCPGFFVDQSRGFSEWYACSACAYMIDAENWNGLLMRAVHTYSGKFDSLPRRILTDRIKRTHDLFRAHYRKAESDEEAESGTI